MLFNYLGQLGQLGQLADGGEGADGPGLFAQAAENSGPALDPRGRRSHLLEVNCIVLGGRLQAEWTFSADRHQARTVERLADAFFAELRRLIAHCQAPESGAYTPSDFPEADLSEEDFATLMARLAGAE